MLIRSFLVGVHLTYVPRHIAKPTQTEQLKALVPTPGQPTAPHANEPQEHPHTAEKPTRAPDRIQKRQTFTTVPQEEQKKIKKEATHTQPYVAAAWNALMPSQRSAVPHLPSQGLIPSGCGMPAGGTGPAGKSSPAAGPGSPGPFGAVPGRGPRASPAPPLCDVSPRRSAARRPARPGPAPYLVGGHGAEPLEDGGDVLLAGLAHGAGRTGRAAGGAAGRRAGAAGAARAAAPGRSARRARPGPAPGAEGRCGPARLPRRRERCEAAPGCWRWWGTGGHPLSSAQSHGSVRLGKDLGDGRAQPLSARHRGTERHVHPAGSSRGGGSRSDI